MDQIVELLEKKRIHKTSYQLLGLVLALLVIYLIVYLSGGTTTTWAQLNLIVIVVSGYYFGKGSLVIAGLAAFLMGPLMPLEVGGGINQDLANMAGRLAIYLAFALSSGVFFSRDAKLHRSLIEITSRDDFSGLLNKNILISHLSELINQWDCFYLIIVKVDNLDGIGKYVDVNLTKRINDALIATLKKDLVLTEIYSVGFGEYCFVMKKEPFKNGIGRLDFLIRHQFKNLKVDNYDFNLITKAGVVLHDDLKDSPLSLLNNTRVALDQGDEFDSGIYFYDNYQALSNRQSYEVANSLLSAIANNEFYLLFQPITNLQDNRITCVEVLIRWNRPGKEPIGPAIFIEIAEKIGMITQISKWVVIQGIKQLKHWHKIGIQVQLSINITVKEIENDQFVDWLTSYVAKEKIAPSCIKLEITERVFTANGPKLEKILTKLRKQGFAISVDDFGTGYNSLLTFAKIPMDSIKIDKYFTDNLENLQIHSLVKAIIDFIHELEKNVIIEGVETKSQIKLLENLQADEIQGYYFFKPLSPYEFQEYYFKNHRHHFKTTRPD